MRFSTGLIVAFSALLLGVTADNTVDIFTDGGCSQYITTFFEPGDGGCQAVNGGGGVRVTGLNGGCSATVYSDSSCSDSATQAGIGACMDNAQSFTVDCS